MGNFMSLRNPAEMAQVPSTIASSNLSPITEVTEIQEEVKAEPVVIEEVPVVVEEEEVLEPEEEPVVVEEEEKEVLEPEEEVVVEEEEEEVIEPEEEPVVEEEEEEVLEPEEEPVVEEEEEEVIEPEEEPVVEEEEEEVIEPEEEEVLEEEEKEVLETEEEEVLEEEEEEVLETEEEEVLEEEEKEEPIGLTNDLLDFTGTRIYPAAVYATTSNVDIFAFNADFGNVLCPSQVSDFELFSPNYSSTTAYTDDSTNLSFDESSDPRSFSIMSSPSRRSCIREFK
jgi:hypothetical protein